LFCTLQDTEEIPELERILEKEKSRLFVIGSGSNILFDDEGFDGLVCKVEIKGMEFQDKGEKVCVIAGAGEEWDFLVSETVKRGLYGLENLSLIPGTVGATPVQNIGAYGAEVKDCIDWVEVYDLKKKKIVKFARRQCGFGYRTSFFKSEKGKRYIILRAAFLLGQESKLNTEYPDLKEYFRITGVDSPSLAGVRDAVVAIRTLKLPNLNEIGTAGSFFKNPIISSSEYLELKEKYSMLPSFRAGFGKVKVPLGWIIDRICNLKGYRIGNVGLHQNQALVVVNFGGATAKEIKMLAAFVAQKVKEKTGIEVEPEVQFVD